MSPNERARFAPFVAHEPPADDRIAAVDVAKGLLILLAIVPVAALAAAATPVGARGLAFFALLGDLLVVPAFMLLAGLVARRPPSPPGVLRRRALTAGSIALALLAAAAVGVATQRGWKAGVLAAAPGLGLLVLPLLYGLVLRALRLPAVLIVAFAALLHVMGVIFGGAFAAVLAPFIYFVGGALFAPRLAGLLRLAAREWQFAAASGPIVIAAALMLASRIIPGLHAARLADIGPATLALGFSAGFAVLASAQALVGTPAADMLQRLGRTARAAAIAWLPLFFAMVAFADRGFAPSAASLALFALASILFVFVVVDLARGLAAQTTTATSAR